MLDASTNMPRITAMRSDTDTGSRHTVQRMIKTGVARAMKVLRKFVCSVQFGTRFDSGVGECACGAGLLHVS